MLVNMSVWRDVESLNQYVYRSAHVDIMRRRKEWFETHARGLFSAVVGAAGASPEYRGSAGKA